MKILKRSVQARDDSNLCRQDSNLSRISAESQISNDELLQRPKRNTSVSNEELEEVPTEEFIEDSSVPQLSAAPILTENSNLLHRTTSNTS